MDHTHVPVLKARLKTQTALLVPRRHGRTLAQLRRAYPDLGPDELARQLIADAARSSAAVGAASASCALLPVPGAAALASAGESASAGSLRKRLAAELHTVYGLPDPGADAEPGDHLEKWASPEVLASLAALPALALSALRAAPKHARREVSRKARTLLTTSAVLSGLRAGRRTRRQAEALRRDLSADPAAWSQWPPEAGEPAGPAA